MARKYLYLVMAACLVGCASIRTPDSTLRADLLQESTLDCFAKDLRDLRGDPVFCEASAVVVNGQTLMIASDKSIPGGSPVFAVRMEGNHLLAGTQPQVAPPFLLAEKIEDMTKTPDGLYALATTGFDRIHPEDARLDNFNTLMAWPINDPAKVRVVTPTERDGKTSSLAIRDKLSRHLGLPYFKVEGLMAIPGNKLVFGIREAGQSHKNFFYKVLLLEIDYRIDQDGIWHLGENLRTLLDFSLPGNLGLPQGQGISSLEYDAFNQLIYFSTSHESEGQLGAYLWYCTLSDLMDGRHPRIVLGSDGKPYHFENKAEGIAVLDRNRLFVIHDDDRVTGGRHVRAPHQAVYSVLHIQFGQ